MEESQKLENQICFPICVLSRQMAALYRPYLDKLELTYPQYFIMMVLWEHKSRTVKELGDTLLLDSGTLTPLLKRMEANGLLIRKRSSVDERVVNIIISKKGELLKKEAESIPLQIEGQLYTNAEQLAKLRKQLERLLHATSKLRQ